MRFFFYGTLISTGDNRMARLVATVLDPLGPARARGLLHGIPDPHGWYPALLPGDGEVRGMLYEAGRGFGVRHLARFDAYEDYDAACPEASLYIREAISVRTRDGATGWAEAYMYKRPLPAGARPIPGGDFCAWLASQGLRPFGG